MQGTIQLLSYGTMGLSVIFMFVAAKLFKTEASRKGEPRRGIIIMFCVFLGFLVVMAITSLTREVIIHRASAEETDRLELEVGKLESALRIANQDKATISSELDSAKTERANIEEKFKSAAEQLKLAHSETSQWRDDASNARDSSDRVLNEKRQVEARLLATTTAAENAGASYQELVKKLQSELSAANDDRAKMRDALSVAGIGKTIDGKYFYEETLPVGEGFVDKLTGVAATISSVTSFKSISGAVTLPSTTTKTETFSLVPSGSAWPYTWSGRTFVLLASATSATSVRYTVRETTAK